MTIHTASQRIYKLMIAIGLLTALASCGGGGGGPKKDATPDAFTFTAVANAAVNTEVTSALVTTTGFNQQVSISITGGTYSIGGGAFSNAAGTITNGQTVSVKVTSATSTNTPVEAVLIIGGVSGSFTVTTAPDITPDTFSFTAVTAVVPKSENTSTAITVAGIDIAVPISITGGKYSINDGAFTSEAGTVTKTQKVKVLGIASASTTTTTNVVLTISDKNATYAITTLADTVAPTAQILFPPPVSMTEGNTILVRGSAIDDYNTVTSIKVNGVIATTTDGFKNWRALVPLADTMAYVIKPTENTITVVTEDSAGNKSDNAAHVAIKQAPVTTTSVPNTNNGFTIYPWGMVVDKSNGNNRLLLTDEGPRILSIDLTTSERTVFANVDSQCNPRGISIDSSNQHLYVACSSSKIYNFDLADSSKVQIHSNPLYYAVMGLIVNFVNGIGKVITSDEMGVIVTADLVISNPTVFSDAAQSIPNASTPIGHSWSGIAYDKDRNRYLMSDYLQQAIFSVDAGTGVRTLLSNNTTGSGALFTVANNVYLAGVAVDDINHRLIVTEGLSGKLFSVDLITGDRLLLSSTTAENPFNKLLESYIVTIIDPNGYALLSDYTLHGVYAVDLVTGYRVVFSK